MLYSYIRPIYFIYGLLPKLKFYYSDYYYLKCMITRSSSCVCLSDLETSRGEPGSRVLVQADNSFSARRRPVLWADIQDVVHCLLWGTTFTDRGVLEAPLQHGRAEPAYTRAKAVEGCPLLSRQVEARDAVWIADEVVQSRRRSCQPIVFPAGPEPGLLRHAWGRCIVFISIFPNIRFTLAAFSVR